MNFHRLSARGEKRETASFHPSFGIILIGSRQGRCRRYSERDRARVAYLSLGFRKGGHARARLTREKDGRALEVLGAVSSESSGHIGVRAGSSSSSPPAEEFPSRWLKADPLETISLSLRDALPKKRE